MTSLDTVEQVQSLLKLCRQAKMAILFPITEKERRVAKMLDDLIDELAALLANEVSCEASKSCREVATHEIWWRVRDFSGNVTGLRQKYRVCKEHADEIERMNNA